MFDKIKPGEWVRPIRRGYRAACCDCGLVHRMDFRVVEGRAEFRAYRDDRKTKEIRRAKAAGERRSGPAEDTLRRPSAGGSRRITRATLQADIDRLRAALKTVGDDYPNSSCQQWCYEQAGLRVQNLGTAHP